ncbi:MAG: hypothetical protein HOP29_14600 [Phycisphaerales bacterium]|nr:hypothetical protein [Phycisphaerales bacterium]
MKIASTLSTAGEMDRVVAELCEGVGDVRPDFAALWLTRHHGPTYENLVEKLHERLAPKNMIGCTCAGVIGPQREIEDAPGAVLWVAETTGVRVFPFVVDQNDLRTMKTAADWQDRLGVNPDDIPTFIILPDPFSVQFDVCLRVMDEVFPGSVIVGGVASGARSPGENRLFLNDQILRQGMVGVALTGPFRVSTLVSQGCRAVGASFVITKAESNVIYELGGRDAYAVLKDVHDRASATDQALIRSALHVGRVIDEHHEPFGPGDFLIRNVAGVVENRGLAVTDFLRAGQTIQFHVRDSASADAEMRTILNRKVGQMLDPPVGGLLFNCNGRGENLFQEKDHDIGLINNVFPACPVGGFFAGGEIGPVGGKTFVHGFTSSLILFFNA